MKTVGSRAEVFHGNAKRTSGRLVKDDLMKNAAGRIVSKKKHEAGKSALKFLHAKGYIAVKGKFGSARKEDKEVEEHKMEGGSSLTTGSELDLNKLDIVVPAIGVDTALAAIEAVAS